MAGDGLQEVYIVLYMILIPCNTKNKYRVGKKLILCLHDINSFPAESVPTGVHFPAGLRQFRKNNETQTWQRASTEEMARILDIASASVTRIRYRLRPKFNIPEKASLDMEIRKTMKR